MKIKVKKVTKSINVKTLLLYFVICCIFGCTKIYNEDDLYGAWEGGNGSAGMSITFHKDTICEIVYREKNSEQVALTGNFEVDFTKKPIPLSIRNIPRLNHPLHTIIQFKTVDILRMAEFAPRWRLRPISFDRDTEIILMRKNE